MRVVSVRVDKKYQNKSCESWSYLYTKRSEFCKLELVKVG